MHLTDLSGAWMFYAILGPLVALPPLAIGLAYIARGKYKAFNECIRLRLADLRAEADAAYAAACKGDHENDSTGGMGTIPEGDEDIDDDKDDAQVQRFEDLPACVREFLHHCVRDDRLFRLIKLTEIVKIRFTPTGKWKEMSGATQFISPLVPAFLFTGTARMAKGLWARGYESLSHGSGHTNWRLFGAYSVADGQGSLMDKAARARWLCEAVCFPQALKPSRCLWWEGVKARPDQARAFFDDGCFRVSCLFTFHRGKVVAVESGDYARLAADGKAGPVGLRGRCGGHMLFGLTPPGQLPNRETSATAGGVVVPTDMILSFVEEDGREWEFLKTVVASVRPE
jgi:hypothetical protein